MSNTHFATRTTSKIVTSCTPHTTLCSSKDRFEHERLCQAAAIASQTITTTVFYTKSMSSLQHVVTIPTFVVLGFLCGASNSWRAPTKPPTRTPNEPPIKMSLIGGDGDASAPAELEELPELDRVSWLSRSPCASHSHTNRPTRRSSLAFRSSSRSIALCSASPSSISSFTSRVFMAHLCRALYAPHLAAITMFTLARSTFRCLAGEQRLSDDVCGLLFYCYCYCCSMLFVFASSAA